MRRSHEPPPPGWHLTQILDELGDDDVIAFLAAVPNPDLVNRAIDEVAQSREVPLEHIPCAAPDSLRSRS